MTVSVCVTVLAKLIQAVEGLMYAFGDVQRPDPASVALMEDMTVTFLLDLCRRARPIPHQMPIPSNPARVQNLASAVYAQQQTEYEQQMLDEAAERAASGSSSSAAVVAAAAKRRAAQRTNGSTSHAAQNETHHDMPIRTNVHPFVGRNRMTVEDVKFACRKDPKLTSRIEELIYLDKVITSVRRGFDVPDEGAIADTAAADDSEKGQIAHQNTTPSSRVRRAAQ